MCYLCDHCREYRACRQRLHDISHRLNPKEKNTKSKNCLTDVFHLLGFADKGNDKACKNDQINIIADLKCNDLRRHCCTNVGTKYNRNCLRKTHQSRTDKTNRHNCCRTAAL